MHHSTTFAPGTAESLADLPEVKQISPRTWTTPGGVRFTQTGAGFITFLPGTLVGPNRGPHGPYPSLHDARCAAKDHG